MITTSARIVRRAAHLLAPLLYTLAAGITAQADDTEILTGESLPFAAPNIMFIIDTSGSMDADVLVDDSYDASVTYTGPYTDASRLYYTFVDRSGNFDYPPPGYEATGNWVATGSLVCDAAVGALANDGNYTDFFAQFFIGLTASTWTFLDQAGNDRITECLADEGVHGLTAGDPQVYPVNINELLVNPSPYSEDELDPNRIDWLNDTSQYIFFSNNYLNWIAESAQSGEPVVKTRLRIVQDVTTNLVNRITINNQDPDQKYNVGLMRFSTTAQGGMVLQEVSDIATNGDAMRAAIDGLTAQSSTPLAETVFEAYQYYKGAPVDFGLNSLPVPSTSGSQTNGVYDSPLISSCQKNYLVLLTDGQPTSDQDADMDIEALTGTCQQGNCLDELTQYMDSADFSTFNESQTIQTFTIGFFTDSALLQDAATGQVFYDMNGDLLDPPRDGYFTADDVDELQVAFDSILDSINSDVDTFTSPAVSVDSLNRLTNRDVLYFTLFVPPETGEPHWDGNLKAYFVGRESNDPSDPITILDVNGARATDDNGIFHPNAQSIWSSSPDGPVVTEGGFAGSLDGDRQIVTNIVSGSLFSDENRVSEDNDLITLADLGIADPDERDPLLMYARGLNEDGTPHRIVGDPLHAQPLIITYGNPAEDDLALFFSTNDGYFHHVDPTPSTDTTQDLEQFAFIPRELLDNLDEIKRNPPSLPGDFDKVYGLDGPISAYIKNDDNFIVDSDEQLFVIFAMRRGGQSYYALDFGVGGKNEPRLAWKISRGDANFSKLGQTWSAATAGKVKLGGAERDVLFFAGGYAAEQDSGYGPNESKGNAIYMVDAATGDFIWSASNNGASLTIPEMTYAIPSDITVLDVDQDGFVDRLYVGDMGAQVFRFDIDNNATGGGLSAITGDIIASLGGEGTANERRFHNKPSVARIVSEHGDSFLSIAIGSGYRAHPLETAQDDRFYLLKDFNVFTAPAPTDGVVTYPEPLTSSDLLEIAGDISPAPDALAGAGGWFIELDAGNGEKNLSTALTVNNQVFFATYSPESVELSCQPTASVGTGRLYAIDIFTGLPALFSDSNAEPNEYSTILDRTGIPPAPTLVFTEPPCTENCDGGDPPDDDEDPAIPYGGLGCEGAASEVTMFLATESFNPRICTAPVRTYWYESDVDNDDD